MLKKLDPRLILLWWICFSTLVLYTKSQTTIIVAFGVLIFLWIVSGRWRKLVSFTIYVLPLIIFIALLFRGKDWQWIFALRLYTMIGSTILTMSMGNARLINALHNLHIGNTIIDPLVDLMSNLFGEALMTFSVVAQELRQLREAQLARGVNINSPNPLVKVRHSMRLAVPLLSRMFARHSQVGRMTEIMGYDPFAKRSIYNRLNFAWQERLIAALLIATTLALVFKV